ncbi:polysaccharide pyruvyl transferase family protein [Roseomonas mucosa]|uniref:polysaccharide pyruvyl transferase family protein n=1 Tax=Roseomonas mucosa TaxID=207340 RepID=UPI0028CE827F|nr:hypothetical protein [Roseomonas mucosa]MDT8315770.1 hypothetical protein [Roseomonas mucosa]MDT8362169.1 hypothetical protein [Roseomonas mucosa]
MILNLHRVLTSNIGDLKCAPFLYFDFLKDTIELDLLGSKQSEVAEVAKRRQWIDAVASADAIIIGGGGLIGIDFFAPGLKAVFELKRKECKTILWGSGHNAWQIGDWRNLKFNVNLDGNSFDLVGIRDYNQGHRWVPCVSCMSELFDLESEITREVGLYVHGGTLKNEAFRKRLPGDIEVLSNDATFEEVIKYLASCDVILTDSYHGAYWGTLLQKKVIAFPSSSKFYDLKHPIPLCAPEDWERFAQLSRIYSNALVDCREANIQFSQEVRTLLKV